MWIRDGCTTWKCYRSILAGSWAEPVPGDLDQSTARGWLAGWRLAPA